MATSVAGTGTADAHRAVLAQDGSGSQAPASSTTTSSSSTSTTARDDTDAAPATTTTTTAPPSTTVAPSTTPTTARRTTTTARRTTTTAAPLDRDADDEESAGDLDTEAIAASNPLLVPGPSEGRRQVQAQAPDDDAESDTTVLESEEAPAQDSGDDSAEATVRRVMFALIGVAVLLTALTVYYWWWTRPPVVSSSGPRGQASGERAEQGNDDGDDGTVGAWQTDSTSTR